MIFFVSKKRIDSFSMFVKCSVQLEFCRISFFQNIFLTERTDFDIRTDMNTIRVSVTDFRNNLADYLNAVKYEKKKIIVKKNRSVMAEVFPQSAKDQTKKRVKRRVLPEVFGMWKNRKDMQGPIEEVAARLRDRAWRGNYDHR